ncbi:hypothetical protein RhiirB3_440750 [Rhizophagus irregularis]|nr:hypothetical protein RhiirB3_440750 [Rhizophagus irregularis]
MAERILLAFCKRIGGIILDIKKSEKDSFCKRMNLCNEKSLKSKNKTFSNKNCKEKILKAGRYVYQIYGISKDPTSHSYILIFDEEGYNNLCIKCQILSYFFDWCESCKLNNFQLNYGEFPSGNNEIDKILKDNYCKSRSPRELIKWIPYKEFYYIKPIADDKNSAIWLNHHIYDWNSNNLNWDRKIEHFNVMLINSQDLDHIYEILKAGKYVYQIYGISKDPTSHSYILIFDEESYNKNLCIKCQILSSFFDWCKSCKLDNFQLNYGEFPSENDEIDKILKDNYCKSRSSEEFIEWIPYDEFKDIIHIADDKNSAIWLNGYICDWNSNNLNWNRKIKNFKVMLINSEDLDHIYKILKAGKYVYQIYGISKDPTSHIYILVFDDEGYNQNLCIKCQILSSFFDWCKSCKLDNFQLNYGEFPSENDEIDKILKDNYCKSRSSEEFIEWIPYDEFKDIIHIAYHEEIYSADWPKGCIRSWDKDKFNWSREVKRVILVNFKYNVNDFDKVLIEKKKCKFYGISKDLSSLVSNYILVFDDKGYNQNLCIKCQFLSYFFNWCKRCKLCHFQLNYGKLLSENKDIDVILKGNYCKSNKMSEFIEWIPYSSFIDISYINQGGFSKVYSALWLNNNIYEWDQIELEWKRLSGYKKVVLKVLESSCYNISGFLQEVQSYCKIGFSHKITKLYGISKEPNTQNYVLVLEYINHGSLRGFLDKYNKYLITTYKIRILKNIAEGIKEIHSKNIIHQDIHSENILTKDFDRAKITDLGLSKFVSRDEKKENVYKVYGNLPYIAPEVLRGKRYTQNADIYAFGIIINEVFTGERPFHDVIDDNLMLDICKNGLRPKIGKNTPKSLVHLLNKCWDATPSNRPTVDEIIQNLNHFETDDIIFEELRNYNNGVIKQYFELTSKSDHLKTSNSSKLHSINPSNFTGVLYCCISNENEEIGSASTSRNNYQVTNLSSETVIIDDSSECDNCIIKLNLSGNYT